MRHLMKCRSTDVMSVESKLLTVKILRLRQWCIPASACSAFSRREGSRMRRLMRLWLNGSNFGTLWSWLLLCCTPSDAVLDAMALQLPGLHANTLPFTKPITWCFDARAWGATACKCTAVKGAVTPTDTISPFPQLKMSSTSWGQNPT